MKKKPMSINVILNGIRTLLSLLFPLITFPYITRVLSPEGVGQANFSNSIINYFILLGGLGITAYAIREGAKKSEQSKEFERFAGEIWTISLLAAAFAYVSLFVALGFVPKLYEYRLLIGIYSVQILTNAIGMEWILNVYEEYRYVTVRSFLFQLLSLILLFLFVKKAEDVYLYVTVQTISASGIGIANYVYVRKRVRLRLIRGKELLRHMPPILLIFSTTLATTVYVNLDTSMLGFIWGDEQVGYYTVSAKLYNIVKALINSIVTVYAVRLSSLYYRERKEYDQTFREIYQIITGLAIPMAVGGYLLCEEIIVLLGGEIYLPASESMILLMFSLIFATVGNLFGAGALLIVKKESNMFTATLLGAVINTLLNYILIHEMKCTGAALATLITEIAVCSLLFWRAKKWAKIALPWKHIWKAAAACTLFVPLIRGIQGWELHCGMTVALCIFACVPLYVLLLLLLKDEFILNILEGLKRRKK